MKTKARGDSMPERMLDQASAASAKYHFRRARDIAKQTVASVNVICHDTPEDIEMIVSSKQLRQLAIQELASSRTELSRWLHEARARREKKESDCSKGTEGRQGSCTNHSS